MTSGLEYDLEHQEWLSAPSSLSLYCDGDHVGTVNFDLADYVGKKPEAEKVKLGERLVGDIRKYPDCWLLYRIKIEPVSE